MLSVSNLSKSFPSPSGPRMALDRLSFELAGGDVLCVLGPNGSGKTTLLKVLAGLVLPDAGTVEVAGETGFSPGEERSFYGRLTGLDNLRFFAALRGLDSRRLATALERLRGPLGLEEVLGVTYQQASAGLKQRLSLARALLHDPAVLLFDEPAKSLDPEAAGRLRDFIRGGYAGRPGRAVLWSAHREEEARELGARVLRLDADRATA